MSIWLGFPEESSSEGAAGGTDNIQTLIDEIQTKDQEVDQLQDQIVVELENLDNELKKTEKEGFVGEAELLVMVGRKRGQGLSQLQFQIVPPGLR